MQDPTKWLQGVGTQQCRGPLENFYLQEFPTAPTKRSVLERCCGGLTLTIWSAREDVITICFYIQRKCLSQRKNHTSTLNQKLMIKLCEESMLKAKAG